MWDETFYIVGDVVLKVFDEELSFKQVCRRIYLKKSNKERFDLFLFFLYYNPGVYVRRFHICDDSEFKFARLNDDPLEIYIWG